MNPSPEFLSSAQRYNLYFKLPAPMRESRAVFGTFFLPMYQFRPIPWPIARALAERAGPASDYTYFFSLAYRRALGCDPRYPPDTEPGEDDGEECFRGPFFCVCCHVATVDALHGFDTCADCLKHV